MGMFNDNDLKAIFGAGFISVLGEQEREAKRISASKQRKGADMLDLSPRPLKDFKGYTITAKA